MPTLTDKQALNFLSRLFPAGLKDPELLAEVCPDGWEASPLWQVFNPTPEQRYEEHLRWLRSPVHEMSRRREKTDPPPPTIPTFEEFLAKEVNPAPQRAPTEDEWLELLGACLWDILSNNHKLVTSEGEVVGLGSFRMVSSLIDDFLENRGSDGSWRAGDYMRFYMGSIGLGRRATLEPVYRLIFRRIKQLGYEWRYSFPRIHVVRFNKDQSDDGPYDPSTAFAKDEERKAEEEKRRKMDEALARDLVEAKQQALDRAPPATVLAYQEVYGADPHGWPPDPDSPD